MKNARIAMRLHVVRFREEQAFPTPNNASKALIRKKEEMRYEVPLRRQKRRFIRKHADEYVLVAQWIWSSRMGQLVKESLCATVLSP